MILGITYVYAGLKKEKFCVLCKFDPKVHPNLEVVNVSTRTRSISAIFPLSSGNIAPWLSTKKIRGPLFGERDLGLSFDLLGDKERSCATTPNVGDDGALACCGDMEPSRSDNASPNLDGEDDDDDGHVNAGGGESHPYNDDS
jgi:hypothetical protein